MKLLKSSLSSRKTAMFTSTPSGSCWGARSKHGRLPRGRGTVAGASSRLCAREQNTPIFWLWDLIVGAKRPWQCTRCFIRSSVPGHQNKAAPEEPRTAHVFKPSNAADYSVRSRTYHSSPWGSIAAAAITLLSLAVRASRHPLAATWATMLCSYSYVGLACSCLSQLWKQEQEQESQRFFCTPVAN